MFFALHHDQDKLDVFNSRYRESQAMESIAGRA